MAKDRKKCGNCKKNRWMKHYENPKARYCDMCKVSIKYQKKQVSQTKTKGYYIKQLDVVVGARVRVIKVCMGDRDHSGPLQWAHIVSRQYRNTRWLLSNAMCLCQACHYYYTNRPLEWEMFVIECIGEDVYANLKREALAAPRYKTTKDLEELLEEMK